MYSNFWLNEVDVFWNNADHLKKSSGSGHNDIVPTKKHKAANKKNGNNDGRPHRPLTSYNIFFKMERKRIMQEQASLEFHSSTPNNKRNPKRNGKHANVGFANLARMVSTRWRSIDANTKQFLEEQARMSKEQYKMEMEEWTLKKSISLNKSASTATKTEATTFASTTTVVTPAPVRQTFDLQVFDFKSVDEVRLPYTSRSQYGNISANVITPETVPQKYMSDFNRNFPALPLFNARKYYDANVCCASCNPVQECNAPNPMMNSNTSARFPPNKHQHTWYCSNDNQYGLTMDCASNIDVTERISSFVDGMNKKQALRLNMAGEHNSNPNCFGNAVLDAEGYNYNDLDFHREEIEDVVHGMYTKRKFQFMKQH